jgi:hypothetical protein
MLENTPSDESATARSSEQGVRERHPKLSALLPPKDAPYAYSNLSKAETDAFVEALGDGFGPVHSPGYVASPLPKDVQSGLVEHSFYIGARSEYDADEGWVSEFWDQDDPDDAPAPYEVFPLGFNLERLCIYFEHQFLRFCEQVAREDNAWDSFDLLRDRWIFEDRASSLLYQKPWYEFHALQLFDFMAQSQKMLAKHPNFMNLMIVDFAGKLGRLIEQYYWRFRYEGAAITGTGARKGASAGGRAKAQAHQAQHALWQKEAATIWAQRPGLSKSRVADKIRKKLGATRSAKHIARYIIRLK